jgi:hypothetical protein
MKDRVITQVDERSALEAVAKHIPSLAEKMISLGGAAHHGLCPCSL